MTVKIADEQLKKIILEETKQVLEEKQAINEYWSLIGKGASKLAKPVFKGLRKALGSLKKAPKTKAPKTPKDLKAPQGFGKFKTSKTPKGAPAGGLGTLGAAAQKDPSILGNISVALLSAVRMPYGFFGFGLLANVAWELIDDVISAYRASYLTSDVAGADMMAYSNAVEQKYIIFLTKAGELVSVPADSNILAQIFSAVYVIFLGLPYKIAITILSGGVPIAEYLKADSNILGFFDILNEKLLKERKQLLDNISDIVEMYGPLEMGTTGELFKVNKRRNPVKMRLELVKLIDTTVFEQAKRAKSQDVPMDPASSKAEVIQAMDDFLRALNNYEKAIPDEIYDRAQKTGVPKAKPTVAGSPTSAASPDAPKAPAPMSKRILMKRVEATLRDNGVRDSAQREGWVSWANTTRQSGLASEDRIVSFLDKWFGSVRANVLEENRVLFTEVKLYLPKKGEFQKMSSVKNFVKWLAKNNISLGKSEDFGLHNIGWLEYLFNIVDAEFKQKKALRRRSSRISAQITDIKAEIDELSDQLETEQDPKKAEKIESKITKLMAKAGRKIEKASTVRTKKKIKDTPQ